MQAKGLAQAQRLLRDKSGHVDDILGRADSSQLRENKGTLRAQATTRLVGYIG
jgi:hypothetical protein